MEVVIPSGNLGDPTSLARENCFVEKNVGGSFTNLAPNLYTAAVLSVNPWVSGIQPHSFRCRWGRLRVDYAFQVNPWASGFGRTRFGAAEDAYGLTPPSKSIPELQDSAALVSVPQRTPTGWLRLPSQLSFRIRPHLGPLVSVPQRAPTGWLRLPSQSLSFRDLASLVSVPQRAPTGLLRAPPSKSIPELISAALILGAQSARFNATLLD